MQALEVSRVGAVEGLEVRSFFFSSRRRHTRSLCDWSSDVCSSDLELGFGSGVTCWRRLDEWQKAGVWERLHELLLARLRTAGEIEWSRAVADASHVQAKKGA